MNSPDRNATATPAQLKNDIDSGRMHDKVAAFDPAAAPLGTDEEAAGTPTPGWAIEAERWRRSEASTSNPQQSTDAPASPAAKWMSVVVLFLFLAASLTAWLAI